MGTIGNHELDKGRKELLRLLRGGNLNKEQTDPFIDPYPGARFPYVSANVLDATTHEPILPP